MPSALAALRAPLDTHSLHSFIPHDVFQSTQQIRPIAPVFAASSIPDGDNVLLTRAIDEFIRETLDFWGVHGATVAVVRRRANTTGFDVSTRGYGRADRAGRPMTADTPLPIASNSKAFVASALGLLVKNSSIPLDWSTKVHTVLPEFALSDAWATRDANVIDVLSHRTGVPRHDWALRSSALQDGAIEDFSLRVAKHLEMSTEFRETLQYNNHMYNIGASLVSHLSNTSFPDFVEQHIFQRAGLSAQTRYLRPSRSDRDDGLGEGFVLVGENATFGGTLLAVNQPRTVSAAVWGAGGVISTANDLAIWLQTLLDCGRSPKTGEEVVPCDVLRRMEEGVTIYRTSAPPELTPAVYGMGLSSGAYQGHQYIDHSGSELGYMSHIARFPNDGLGIAILTNSNPRGKYVLEAVRWRIAEELLGLPLRVDWNTRFEAAHKAELEQEAEDARGRVPSPPDAPAPSAGFAALAGTYTHPAYGPLHLRLLPSNPSNSNTFVLEAHDLGWLEGLIHSVQLTHFSGDIFNCTVRAAYPTADGAIVYDDGPGPVAEFEADRGVGFRGGMWGAGAGVQEPRGTTPRARSEVWFTRVGGGEAEVGYSRSANGRSGKARLAPNSGSADLKLQVGLFGF